MKNSARSTRVAVSADGKGLVSQAGAVLLWQTMRVTGLSRGLSENLARWRAPRAVHDPGKIVADLAAVVALGGDCLADIAVLREQPELAGPVASDPVVSRLVSSLAGDLPRALEAYDKARGLGENTAGLAFMRAITLDKMRQLKPALEAYEQFLALSQGKNPDQEFQARQRVRIIRHQLETH